MLRRFVVEAVEKPGQCVPIFATVIDIVRLAKMACQSENDQPRELFEAVVANAAADGGVLRARYMARALSERRALFLIDSMDEAGEQANLL